MLASNSQVMYVVIADHSLQGHGTLDAIYASVAKSCKVRGWDGVDLLIIGGDFQVCRCSLASEYQRRTLPR